MKNTYTKFIMLLTLFYVAFTNLVLGQADTTKGNTDRDTQKESYTWVEPIWQAAPATFPQGAQMSVIKGNLASGGSCTVWLKYPANYQIPPYQMASVKKMKVIKGKLMMSFGAEYDPNVGTILLPGKTIELPLDMLHTTTAQEETIVEISGTGTLDIRVHGSMADKALGAITNEADQEEMKETK